MRDDQEDLDIRLPEPPNDLEVACSCGCRFFVPRSMKGGLANCPECRLATKVSGGPEGLFWVLLGGGILLACGLSALIGSVAGWEAGAISLGVCAVVLVILVIAS